MPAQAGRAKHHVRRDFDLLIRKDLIADDGVVKGVECEHRDAHAHHSVDGGGVAVVGCFCGIAPGWALDVAVLLDGTVSTYLGWEDGV